MGMGFAFVVCWYLVDYFCYVWFGLWICCSWGGWLWLGISCLRRLSFLFAGWWFVAVGCGALVVGFVCFGLFWCLVWVTCAFCLGDLGIMLICLVPVVWVLFCGAGWLVVAYGWFLCWGLFFLV